MSFETYLDQAWNQHATEPETVAQGFTDGLSLIQTTEDLNQMLRLITHVMGQHLGKWQAGMDLLSSLRSHRLVQSSDELAASIERSVKAFRLASGEAMDLSSLSISNQIQVLTLAATALSEHAVERSMDFLSQALRLAESQEVQLGLKDPAHRSLAVAGNALACALEERKNRSQTQTELMIFAAQAARKYWQIAGGWLQVERAEYRLAMSFLQAGDCNQALKHAQRCLEICTENQAAPFEFFYGYEALALIEKEKENPEGLQQALDQMQDSFDKLSPEEKPWCEPSLLKLRAH